MFILSGFGDEIAADLDEQLDALHSMGIGHLELRGAWGKNVLDLSDGELAQVKAALAARGMAVSSIGSPIGKVDLDAPFAPHLDDLRKVIGMAAFLGCPYVRLFSFWVAEGEHEAKRAEVLKRVEAFCRAAEGAPVMLLHENEKEIYGDTPERCADILRTVAAPNLSAVFDPANYVQVGVEKPFDRGWPLLGDYVVYAHIKDALLGNGEVVPAGEGDGQVPELLQAMARRSGDYFLSLEPHLVLAGQYAGFSGRQLFQRATDALKALLASQ
ncbi:MAG: sugar phosphate isomerase/epimerase family protein [Anaerolineae bacterium]